MSEVYNASSISVLKGLDPVRIRPGMYTDISRPNHLAQEIIDNAVDEALEGFATEILVTLTKDNTFIVQDNGRGIPVDIHPDVEVSALEVIFTTLHAGGKFSDDSYTYSGGLHGVGSSVVNALSSRLDIWVYRDGLQYHMSFENGYKKDDLSSVKGPRGVKGTKISFTPDGKYFDSQNFSVTRLIPLLKSKAVLCPGLKVLFSNEIDGSKHEWQYASGLRDYMLVAMDGLETLPKNDVFSVNFKGKGSEAEICMSWSVDGEGLVTESYVNLIPTVQGGTHVAAVKSGVALSIRGFCEKRNLLPKKMTLSADDIFECCHYIISLKLTDPSFSGQTKEKLSSREFSPELSGAVKDYLDSYLNAHVDIGEAIAEMIIDRATARLDKSKKTTRKKVGIGPVLPGKLSDCKFTDVDSTELYIVEGDSAGGSAKQARDRDYQAILPLRGKILNSWEETSEGILSSEEIRNISIAIGVSPGSDDLSGLRYGKICILADADSDGLHIATLMCGLFYKHFRPLLDAGHIYIAMPPLYRIDIGKVVFYALDEQEKEDILKKQSKSARATPNIQRFKGLGEMNPSQLKETVMDKDSRRLLRMIVKDSDLSQELLDMLLKKKLANKRKTWIEAGGNYFGIREKI